MLGPIFSALRAAAQARLKPYPVERLTQVYCIRSAYRSFTHTPTLQRQRKKAPFTPSREQKRVAKLCRTKNVVVSARPGSGKTTTAEAIIAAHPDLRVLVLTYSKRLQLETLRRLRRYPNCEVYTFHAMAGKLFGTVIRDDAALSEERRRVLGRNELPRWSPAPFDIIVLDEFQDCTELLFWLANCFILANNQKMGGEPARIVVLGDERQSIYGFRGADDRYLTLASELLRPISPYPFSKAQLSESFRLSIQSVRFINEVFLGGESCITSTKTGPKPIVLRCHSYDTHALAKQLWALVKRHGAQNTAILAPAVRKRGPVQDVVNVLSKKYGVPIAVSIDDEVPLDDRVIEGKMCVSTIHQFKGSERDLVILFGMDSSFFEFFGRNLPDDRCPNEVFVALTRAREQLVLVHHNSQKLMPFVSAQALYETADVIDMTTEQGRIRPVIIAK
ncbi:DNA helicase [Fusarium keratoplasticum]|uniref:DNA helicase n=1 Tax=Fusarium keratoplasticum TaxID=1328300 RepID=A0ACC0QUS4_9HYPO|nr:DNA helicase [Fusarium keratoplasticum]KAI8665850.1 DNA helicase [Fusarium keratoplasticum]